MPSNCARPPNSGATWNEDKPDPCEVKRNEGTGKTKMAEWCRFGLDVLCAIGAVIAFIFTCQRWKRGQIIRKSEFLAELMAKFASPEISTSFYEYIERGSKTFYRGANPDNQEPEFISTADERAIDKLLGFMSYVCYLYENKLIDDNEFSLFAYQLNAVIVNTDIRQYMKDLRNILPDNYPYEYLERYAEKLHRTSDNKGETTTPSQDTDKTLTITSFKEYLKSTFGGMTASASSVKARALTVSKCLNLSLDEMVSDESATNRTLERIDRELSDKSDNVRANLKNAVRHCYQAKHGKRLLCPRPTTKNVLKSGKLAVATMIVSMALGVFADTETVGDYTWSYSTYEMTNGQQFVRLQHVSPNPIGHIDIPSRLAGLPVKSISDKAFMGCEQITSVKIPDEVTHIYESAFKDCTNLSRVEFSPNNNIQYISHSAFGGFGECRHITAVICPYSIKDKIKCLGFSQAKITTHEESRLSEAAERGDDDAVEKLHNLMSKSFMGIEFGQDIRIWYKDCSRTGDGRALRMGWGLSSLPRFRKFTGSPSYSDTIYGCVKSGKLYRIERSSESFPDSATKEEKRAEFERTCAVISKKYKVTPVRSKKESFLGMWHEETAKFTIGQMVITLEWHNEQSMEIVAVHKEYEALAEKEWREDMEKQDGADVL